MSAWSGTFGVAVYHIAPSSCSRLSTSIHADRDTSAILLQTLSSTSSGEAHALRSHRAKTRRAISRYRNGASQRALTGSEAPFRGWPTGGSPSNISRTMGVGNQHQSRKRTGTDVEELLRNTSKAIPNEKKMTWHFRDARRGCTRGCGSRRGVPAALLVGQASAGWRPPSRQALSRWHVRAQRRAPGGVPTCLIPGSSGNWAADLRLFSLAHYSFRDKFPPELIER